MDSTPVLGALLGGSMIGLAAAALLLFQGRIAGITGIVSGLLSPITREDGAWRVAFVLGLLGAGAVGFALSPAHFAASIDRSLFAVALAGLLVGIGTKIGGGCTSGHGVCGVGRFSQRSLLATPTFTGAGAVTVYVVEHVLGGGL